MRSLDDGPVRAILDRLGSHSSTAERRAGQRILRLGARALPELPDAVAHHPNAFARSVAISALAHFGPRARPALLQALRDPAMTVRLHALVGLDRVWHSSAERAVLRLLRDPSGGVRVNAATVLTRRRVRAASRAFVRLLSDPKWYVRLQAVRGLVELDPARAAGRLARVLADPSPAVRRAAGRSLERLGTHHRRNHRVKSDPR